MASSSAREAYREFTTGVSLVTTRSSGGANVMAAEWTFHVSYDPFLISVHIRPGKATYDAIVESREFGVNMVPEAMVNAMAFAGHFTGRDTDKLSSDLFETYPAEKIGAPLLRGATLNAECRVVQQVPMGDHTAFVGEVIAFSVDDSQGPVVLHKGARSAGKRIVREHIVAVASTPASVAPGDAIVVAGELMRKDSASRKVDLILADAAGQEWAHAQATTEMNGRFRIEIPMPADAPGGNYAVRARHGDAQGSAHFSVAA
ncbi:MAG: flavin reductase family protein [Thermoplasmata archaeon]|nr:flavin reductase family protein [Thermoplasmata archaeon]